MKVYLADGISFKGGKLDIDLKSQDNIKTTLGKYGLKPYVTTVGGLKIHSVYAKSAKSGKSSILSALHALKKQKETNLDGYNKALKRAALFSYRVFKGSSIDMITSIESSSPLSHDFIGHLMQYMPNNSGFSYLKAAVKKNNDISSIKLEDTDKISGEFKQRLNKIIQNAKEGNVFEIKKVPVQYRKFIKNWLALESKFSPKVFNKNILLVDDYLTSGTSMYAAYEILKSNGAKNVYALSLVKL